MTELPPPNTRRWGARRKAAVVAAVANGMITIEEARQAASSKCERTNRGHGWAPGCIRLSEGGEIMRASGTRDYPWTVVLVWKPRRRPKCAFSGWYWQGRLL